jgi:glucosamine 6-phosphate synthetase-like amidotransferase/phosphosugar isomerase protein
MANKIKKNDTVTNNIQLAYGNYNNLTVVPANTELKVWKVKRDGTLYCGTTDRNIYYGTIIINSTDVTKVEKPLPTVNIGDIYVTSWGYDQTNIDYYKVTNVKNKTVNLVSIGQKRNYTGHMQGECVPDPSVAGNKIYTKRMINNGDSVSFKMTSYSWAHKWNGKTNHFTEWA